MNTLWSHLFPLFLGFTVMADMLCPLLSAYLRLLLEFAALLSTLTPQSSHHLLITDVFKHCPMSSTSGGDWTCHLVYHSTRSFTCISETAWLQHSSTAAQVLLLLLLLADQPVCSCCYAHSSLCTNFTISIDAASRPLKQDYFIRRLHSKTG